MPTPLTILIDADLADLVPAYLEARRQDIGALETALAAGDTSRIEAIGHRMLGTGASYGFDGLSAIGAALEDAAQASDAASLGPAIAPLIASLREYLEGLEIRYLPPGEAA